MVNIIFKFCVIYFFIKLCFANQYGYPAGMFAECPGVTSKVVITPKSLKELQIILHTRIPSTNKYDGSQQVYRRRLRIEDAAKALAKDKKINFDDENKRTVLYVAGFMDATSFPHTRSVADAYADRGYNVLLLEINFFTTRIYPKAVRLSHELGRYAGEFLAQLSEMTGLKGDNIELCGFSMGGQIIAYIAETFSNLRNGERISRFVAVDPAGPCYKTLPPTERLRQGLANQTLVIHTNIDGFGIAEPLGDVDIYVNGGEWQPSEIPEIPCLVMCSHYKALLYWTIALRNPNKFIAVKCTDVQQARNSACLDNNPKILNSVGIETDFSKPGIFYLPTWNQFPYFQGKSGLKKEKQVFSYYLRSYNEEEVMFV